MIARLPLVGEGRGGGSHEANTASRTSTQNATRLPTMRFPALGLVQVLVMVDDPSLSCSLHRLGTRGALSIVATGAVGLVVPALFLALLLKHSVAVRTDLALHQTGRGRSTPAGNP